MSSVGGYDKQDPNAPVVAIFVVFILLFTIVAGFFVQAYFNQMTRAEYHTKVEATPNAQWDQLKADADKRLNSYGWVDQANNTVHLPIEKAIELTVKDLKE